MDVKTAGHDFHFQRFLCITTKQVWGEGFILSVKKIKADKTINGLIPSLLSSQTLTDAHECNLPRIV